MKKLIYTHVLKPLASAGVLLLSAATAFSQTASPVAVTGYTADVIANGATFTGAVTADVDGAGYYFLNQSFTAFGTPTNFLPNSGIINSAATGGVTFQLADAAVNNSLRLATQNASGTLTFTSPQPAATIYLLATSGSGASTVTFAINFTDGGTQNVAAQTLSDWYNGGNFAIQGIGRTNATALDNGGGASNPRLYQLTIPVSTVNYTKLVESITVTKTSVGGVANVMGVSAAIPCSAPTAQPTSLVLTATTSAINGSFTAAVPAADGYLVVRYPAGAAPVAPVNTTNYAAGSALGTGTVIQASTATTFSVSGLAPATGYDFYIYSYNNLCTGGPAYYTATPLFGSKVTNTCGAFSGTFTIGASGNYPSITKAIEALGNGVSGPVLFELKSDYTSTTETFPIVFNYSGCFSAVNTLTIRPAAGANGLKIVDSLPGPVFDFSGARYVTIDGRPGGIGSSIAVTAAGSFNSINLNIISANASGMAIRLDSGASNNTIKFCDLQGQNATTADRPGIPAGVVYFGKEGAAGNDNNIIDHCNIHSTGAGTSKPTIGIYSLGYDNQSNTAAYVSQFNDNNTISNCNIYDYYSSSNSAGLEVNLGNTGWMISGNSFFETESITVSGFNRAMWLAPYRNSFAGQTGNGFIITNNYIGGKGPVAGGTAYTLNGSSGYFEAMRLELKDAATPQTATSIQGNIIANISVTTSASGTDAFHGMFITGGGANMNVGTVTGNTIGTLSGTGGAATGGITVTNTGASSSHMILVDAPYTIAVRNNTIGNILLTEAGNYFSGIFVSSTATANISNNLISNINAANAGTTSGRYIHGIRIPSGSPVITIAGNTIQGINCNYATTGTGTSQVAGIHIGATAANVSGGITANIIRNLSNASQTTASANNSSIIGIGSASTNTAGITISGNIIDSLVLTGASTSAAVTVIGIYMNGTTSVFNTVAKNFIHTFDATAANTGAIFTGIQADAGTSTFSNNMIRLGLKPDGTPVTTAMTMNGILTGSASANNLHHNSIYIGGSGVGAGASNTYAFRRSATSGAYDIRNNIFANTRSNATTGGKHYSVYLNGAVTGATANYNAYLYAGNGGVFGFNGVTDVPVYNNSGTATPGWLTADANSISGNPNFINPDGTVSTVNLHINTTGTTVVEGKGIAIAAITDDIDGDVRSGLTPVDIGADAGNFVLQPGCTAPDAPTALVLTTVSATSISGSFTASASGASGYIVIRYMTGATSAPPVNGVAYTAGGSFGSGTIVSVGTSTSFTDTGLLASTSYSYYVYAYNSGCLDAPKYSASLTGSQTTNGCSGPSGLITVGPSGTYPTLTAALAALSGGISGPVIVELQNDYTPAYITANETFPIRVGFSACYSPANTVVIRPAANAPGLIIRSGNAGPTIDFSGGNYVTIDGRPGGTGNAMAVTAAGSTHANYLNIINVSSGGTAIRFDNNASRNAVMYCDLQGQNTIGANVPASPAGVVYFGNTGTNGNDNNLIDHCNIHSTGTTVPSIGVYAQGANNTGVNNNFNDNDTISNCNIYDYFLAGGNSAGVELNNGVNAWVVTGNSFFQTATRTYTSAGYNRAIWIIPNRNAGSAGNGFVITNNFIGGSAPLCAGTPYTLSSLGNTFGGIRLEVADGFGMNASTVQGNTITNIAVTSTSTAGATGPFFQGISVTNSTGNVNVSGNTIGSATGNGTISIAAGSGSYTTPVFISNSAGTNAEINVKKNVIGGFTLTNVANNFAGVFGDQLGKVNIDSNLIGSLTTTNSIYTSNAGTTAQWVRGIHIPSSAGTFSIKGNTIANLTNNTNSTTNGSQTAGIRIDPNTAVVTAITGNIIRNLTCATRSTNGSTSAALLGIGMGSTSATSCNISGNTIHSLTSGAATAGVYLEGIFFSGSSNVNTLSGNFVHSFDLTNTGNTAANLRGVECAQGKANIFNNMVRLGIKPDGTDLTNPVRIDGIMKGSPLDISIFYNSVYIGGSNVSTNTNISSAFRKETASGNDDVRNNIFINNRSNATTGARHYAICTDAATGITFDHNIYGYGGTGGAFASVAGLNNTPSAAGYTSGWISGGDNTSLVVDPKFIDPTGAASSVDLHITTSAFSPANGVAVPVSLVTNDIDGEARDASTPDIGADEFTQSNGIDMQAVSLVAPTSAKGCYGKETVIIKIRNNSAATIDFALHPLTLSVNVSGAVTAVISTIINTDTLAAGATKDVALSANEIDMSAGGTYIFDAKTSVAGDIKITNDAMQTVTRTKVALAAGNISASGTSFCFSGTPTFTATNQNGYGIIQWQQSATPGTGYSNILNANGTLLNDTTPQTRYYRLMATCATDTVYSPEIEVIVRSPQVTGTAPAVRCDKGKMTLQATGSAGAILKWYTGSTGGTALATGTSFTTPSLTATTTYYVSASEGGCESERTAVTATISNSISIKAQPIGQIVCPGTAVNFKVSATGTDISFQWRKNGADITGATDSVYTINATVPADAGSYDVVITNSCGAVLSTVAALSVGSANTWIGAVSSDWHTAANWCGGIPGPTADITILAGTPFSPIISADAEVHSLTISRNATVIVDAGGTLNIYGNYISKGTLSATSGPVVFRGAASQSVDALTAANVIVNGAGVVLNGNMEVIGSLTLTSGNIDLGIYNLKLHQSAIGSVASHIITGGTGSVIANYATSAFTVPVGATAAGYNPVIINNGQSLTYTVRVAEGLIASVIDNNKAINRTWTVTTTITPATPVEVTLQYADAEANAGCNPAAAMDAGAYNGITYAVVSPAAGIMPTGSAATRLATVSTTQLGSLVLVNQGAVKVTVDAFSVKLMPTVVTGNSTLLRVSTPRTMNIEWTVTDMTGKLIMKFNRKLTTGVNDINISLPGLANGIYHLRGVSDDGKTPVIRFIVQH